ncbi:PREDICTED: PRUPE_4G279300 [Prunus dulcis]|uniref:PREDICTED: PRUPE_4G279300 n=1 Tax=Prunus dulcis TaxID=3755 RepID=A0A5E4FLA2_PRUDU|nr:PREDICTED: PRUPE_4G279300 [Prunus dulcis]
MASSWEKRIYSEELEFVGRYSLIYYQKKIEGNACALVAIANVLLLMDKLGSTS